jgi:hypothetical protein
MADINELRGVVHDGHVKPIREDGDKMLCPCDWPGCAAMGDPWIDQGWCFWPRKYLWLPEGFFCPEHDAAIRQGQDIGVFGDWPLDTSPKVLAYLEALSQFHDISAA